MWHTYLSTSNEGVDGCRVTLYIKCAAKILAAFWLILYEGPIKFKVSLTIGFDKSC